MLALKYIAMFSIIYSMGAFSEVLELGDTNLSGKKDQPDAMTIVSRRMADLTGSASKFSGVDKIRKELNSRLFDLYTEK